MRALDAEESIFARESAVAFVPAALAEEPGHKDNRGTRIRSLCWKSWTLFSTG
jgi:hypothetical protein